MIICIINIYIYIYIYEFLKTDRTRCGGPANSGVWNSRAWTQANSDFEGWDSYVQGFQGYKFNLSTNHYDIIRKHML